MKTKTKMPKAMYGKTMMKKGGVKKMQKGGMSTLDKLATRAKATGIKVGEKVFGISPNYRNANQENIIKNDANLAKNRANAKKVAANKAKVEANKEKVELNKIKVSANSTYQKDKRKRGIVGYQKGGVKKMQKGGVKKSLPKAQYGENFQGPVTKKTNELVNKEYKGYGPRVYDQDVKDADELKRLRENYDRIPKEVFDEYKKGGMVKRKMKTGGMVNPNANVSYQKIAGSKGVTSGVNAKASASKVASSRGTGGVNTPPSKATPAAKRGGAVKMQKGGTTPRYSKSVYDSQGRIKSQKQMNKKMQKGGMIKRK